MDIASHAARKLARRSSRRQFFKLLGAGSLGAGLFLTRTDVSLGAITGCVGCGGGPCNPCFSPVGECSAGDRRCLRMQDLRDRRRLSDRLQHRRRVVLLPHGRPARRVPVPLLGVQLPVRLLQPFLLLLHEPPDAVPAAAAFRRPTVYLPGGRRAGGDFGGGLDESRERSRPKARPALVAPPVLQAARSGVARHRALPDWHRCLARRGHRLRRLRRRAVQPVRRDRPDLHERRLPVQDLRAGRRLRGGLFDLGRVVLLPDKRPRRDAGFAARSARARPIAATGLNCHCFVQLPMPCNPRQHSGDQPCTCPPLDAPLPSLT